MATDRDRYIELDRRFVVPPGVVDVRQEYSEDSSYDYDDNTLATELVLSEPDSTLPVPASFNIVGQVVRIAPDGTSVVDVTIEFQDNDSIADIEMQVTKV